MKNEGFKAGSVPLCENCDSRSKGFFCDAHSRVLKKLDNHKSFLRFDPGKVIFNAGDEVEGIYCIKKGSVKIEAVNEKGQAHILHIVGDGGTLGLGALMRGDAVQATAIALQPTQVCFIPKKVFQEILEEDSSVARNALQLVSLELHTMEKRLCHATDLTAVERIAEALLHFKDKDDEQTWSRREIAEWAGTTTETAIRTLAKFEKEGLIHMEGRKVVIQNRKGLLEKAKIFV